ncbi:META domain-containing protein [Halomonas sp. ML-15]|uniref:META domain-containing protein n=1 Tax=Halomonas sp. ML-15 TaxID=2773305 RepID=UPI00174752E7|nr:META domain-containing protein [Halomonas sp. ML-15]MBD3896673.1 META domain-containing protein [Halomonas sp. ML-15]
MGKRWIPVLLAMAVMAGCARSPAPDPERAPEPERQAQQSPMVGERWQLILLGTAERWSGEQRPYIEVERDNGQLRLRGHNGCNQLNGRVQFDDGNRIQIRDLASTRMACPDMGDAQRVDALLENAYRYLIDHDRLVFFGSDSRVLGGFQRR